MRIVRHFGLVPAALKGAVVAVGNFDGVHLGHQALIGRAEALARERGAALAVLAFEPHPQEFFRPSAESFRLTPFRVKARLLADLGVDVMFALPFDAAMAGKSAHDFVLDVLVEGLAAGAVVVGEDFQFGKGRSGDVTLLSYMGEMEGFSVEVFKPVAAEGVDKISSTRIRCALREGRPEEAARLLGRCWSVESRVEHGDGRGRTIGVPTANMRLLDCLHPKFGVYAVRASVLQDDVIEARRLGVASFGVRPMFRVGEPLLETWLFDFGGDLYGKHLSVELVSYLRPEMDLPDIDALKARIAADAQAARAALDRAGMRC
ncbi:MAG TPA: bifunctional riboflavin kinase/FAD synthetase [Rhizomicrobium sp.]|nr:bifunctional riboflavin kinase/FAD synthetase [Rhizomicrobium sp.]